MAWVSSLEAYAQLDPATMKSIERHSRAVEPAELAALEEEIQRVEAQVRERLAREMFYREQEREYLARPPPPVPLRQRLAWRWYGLREWIARWVLRVETGECECC